MEAAAILDRSLADCLALAGRVFDLDAIASRKIDRPAVLEYYRQSDPGYRLFHSNEGALHLAMNHNGQYDPAGLYGQPDFVARHLDELSAGRVLEAGCGNGFNTVYLARKYPDRRFVGVDWTDDHIGFARGAADGLANVEFVRGNYEALTYPDQSFDAVFGIETFCQTSDIRRALIELHRVLRPGGRLLAVDCYRKCSLDSLPADLRLAVVLAEKSTAVEEFPLIDEWLDLVRSIGFEVIEVNDESASVLHNLYRFHHMARQFFEDPQITEAAQRTFAPLLLQNALCGLFTPYSFDAGVHGYFTLAMKRR